MSEQRKLIYHTTSTLISASAGTGKTYQLASRYIALLMLGAEPQKIIALTFTRKAAGEFRSRILHALAEGACDVRDTASGRNSLAARIWEVWSGLSVYKTNGEITCTPAANSTPLLPATVAIVKRATAEGKYPEELYSAPAEKELRDYLKLPEQTAAEFAKLLRKVVMAMSELELSTIDSFFNTLVTGNSLELGINNITPLDPTDEPKARRATIGAYLEARTTETEKRTAFLNMFAELTGGKGTKTISRLEKELQSHLSLYRENPHADAWANDSYFAQQSTTDFQTLTQEEASEWNSLAAELSNLLKSYTEKDFPRYIYPGLKKLASRQLGLSPTFTKWANSQGNPGNDFDALSGIDRVIALAVWLYKTLPAKCLHDAKARTRSLFSLLRDYADAYEQRITSTGQFSFNDISRKAKELMTMEHGLGDDVIDSAFCREHLALRTGKHYKHWMLDEFQDTSDEQFETLAPVLEFVIGDSEIPFTEDYPRPLPASLRPYHEDSSHYVADGSLFVVGDDKQGIYGFRTGETQAFDILKTDRTWSEPVKQAELIKSFRSSPVIMGKDGFVNAIFSKLHAVEREDTADNAVDLTAYTHHDTAKAFAGYTELQVIAKDDGDASDSEEPTMKTGAYKAVCSILQRLTVNDKSPINGISIGILTRTNSEAEALVNYLRNNMPELPVLLVKDTLAATACPLGEMLHHLFRWLLHPHESLSLSVVKASFMAPLLAGAANNNEAWLSLRSNLDARGYTRMIQRIFALFPLHSLSEEQQNAHRQLMTTWLNAARAFDAAGGNLASWVRRVATLSSQGVASSRYVQIMTMHKSKGLEFDAVILPFLSDSAIDEDSDLTYFRSPDGRSLLLNPANKETRAAFWPGAFEPLQAEWKQKRSREAYNLLYVAITRARHANYILLNGNALADSKGTFKACARSTSGLIRRAMGDTTEAYTQTTILGTPMGTENWYASLADKSASSAQQTTTATPGKAIPRRQRMSPSALARAEDKTVTEAEDTSNKPIAHAFASSGTDFGTAVHACFEQISWLHEPLPAWLAAPATAEQQVAAAALRMPRVRELFTQAPGQQAYNEQAIEAISDKNEWISGTIDRLVLTHDSSGNVIAAHIIDYKTNKPEPREGYADFYDWLMAHYQPQMRQYRELIARAFALPLERVCVSLLSCPRDFVKAPARVLTYTAKQWEYTPHFCQQELPGLL